MPAQVIDEACITCYTMYELEKHVFILISTLSPSMIMLLCCINSMTILISEFCKYGFTFNSKKRTHLR